MYYIIVVRNRAGWNTDRGWGLGLVGQLLDHTCGVSDRDDVCWDVFRDHCARADDRVFTDRHARADDCSAAEPDVVFDRDRLATLPALAAPLRIKWMRRCEQLNVRTNQDSVAERDRGDIEGDNVKVQKTASADRDA